MLGLNGNHSNSTNHTSENGRHARKGTDKKTTNSQNNDLSQTEEQDVQRILLTLNTYATNKMILTQCRSGRWTKSQSRKAKT